MTWAWRAAAILSALACGCGVAGTYTAQAGQAGLGGVSTPTSKVELFGHLGYVSPSGIVGLFVGCFGSEPCTGSVAIDQEGKTIGLRSSETVFGDDGGIVHVKLVRSARRALAHGRLGVTVTVTDADGPRASTPEELVPFDTHAAIRGITKAFAAAAPSSIRIFGHTGFVNTGGTTGIFLGCFATTKCAGAMTVSAGRTVVGGRGDIYVSPDDGSIVHITLRKKGRRLLAKRHRLTVTVTVKEPHARSTVGRVTLVPYFGDIDDYALVTSPATVAASSTTVFDLALTNASSPGLGLGSAQLTAPSGFNVLKASLPTGARGTVTVSGNVVELRRLKLRPNATLHVKVTAVAPDSCQASSSTWTSAAWEGSVFNVQELTLDHSRSTASMAVNAPCALRFVTEPAGTTVGKHITASVAVVDAGGKVVTSSHAEITIGLGTNPGDATLDGTKTVRAVDGLATFGDLTLSKPSNGYTLTASGANLPPTTSSSFDESSASTACDQDKACHTSLTTGPSDFEVTADGDPNMPNSGTLGVSVNLGTPLQCAGYSQEDPNWWEFEMTSPNRSKTIVYTLKEPLLPLQATLGATLQGTIDAILQLTQVCFGGTGDFVTNSGTPAPSGTLPDGAPGFIGLLPNCPQSGPCIVSRQTQLDLSNGIGFDIVLTVSIPAEFSGDPWARG